MVVYNRRGGDFDVGSNGDVNLTGPPATSAYRGILFFQDRTAAAATHNLGSTGSCLSLNGTLYMTNSNPTATRYQTIDYRGHPCSGSYPLGNIFVDALTVRNGADLDMRLSQTSTFNVKQIAMVQ
jgi:hypothetical protein